MANPITPSGNRRLDSIEEARRQDEERRIQEDNNYFERTGINRPPVGTYDPLVDNDRPDVANDGDSYEERPFNRHTTGGEYAEDSPTRIIDPSATPQSTVNNLLSIYGRDATRARNSPRSNTAAIRASRAEREAYIQREQIKDDKDFQAKSEKTKKKFKNSITGLDLNEE